MNKKFITKSKFLLSKILDETGGLSFFPSSYFWSKEIDLNIASKSFISYFKSHDYNLEDQKNKLNLYVHIPFCSRICSYCNCFKTQLTQKNQIDEYLKYLKLEAQSIFKLNTGNKIKVSTIFVGGGTPNLLTIEQLEDLYDIIKTYFDLSVLEQFLIDGHPNYYTKSKINYLKKIGVSRLTFAIQSFDERVLSLNNRDSYNINRFIENITYAKKNGIKLNIDLLVGLQGQSFDSIKSDIEYIISLDIDNLSIHYLMNSNNIEYTLTEDYVALVSKVKEYLKKKHIPQNAPNIGESYYASKKNSTISIGASAITNIYKNVIFSKPSIPKYYKGLDSGKLFIEKGIVLSEKDEMRKYIYLNILDGISTKIFFDFFGTSIFESFISEFKFLNKNGVIKIAGDNITSKKNDLDTLVYFNILFLEKIRKIPINSYNAKDLSNFFLDGGELIDK